MTVLVLAVAFSMQLPEFVLCAGDFELDDIHWHSTENDRSTSIEWHFDISEYVDFYHYHCN